LKELKNNISFNALRYIAPICLVLVFLLGALDTSAQSKRLRRAIDKYNYQFYPEAIELLKEEVRENKSAYTPLKYLAGAYRKIKEYQNAELYYNLLVNSDSAEAEDYLYYGQVLKSNGKLSLAKQQFIKFQELEESSFLSKLMLQSLDQIEEWDKERKVFRSIRMDWINTKDSEYGALLFRDKIYITSDREESLTSSETTSFNEQAFLSIYEMDTVFLKKKIANFEEVYGRLNSPYHDGPVTINKEENRAMVSRVDNQMGGKNFVNQLKMYEGEYENGKWKNFKDFPYNSNDYSVGYAHYADGGNVLYFASDMPGGEGGLDLYVSQRVDGEWTQPSNLGPRINTQKNEVFPFTRGEKLYYSSNGFPGYGELDIYVTERSDTGWLSPENLKSPINSNRDDFGIYFVSDTSGYYASNRAGGKGKDDIYGFIKYENNIQVQGVVEASGVGVKGAKVLLVNENDSIVGEAYTDEDGKFVFKNLAYQENYMIKVESEEPELIENSRLFITDDVGTKVQSIEKIETGDFQLTALPTDEIIELQELKAVDELEMEEMEFSGQVFEKLPGDLEEEMVVYLTDKMGVILDSTTTTADGNFSFTRLPPSENYMIKVKEVDTPMNIAFINEDQRVYNIEQINEEGVISVTPTIDASLLVEEAKNKGYTTLIAKLENEGNPIKNTLVEIYDKNDSLIATVVTNDEGEFQYNMLEYDKHYFLRIPDLDEDMRDDALLYVVRNDGSPLYLINLLSNGNYEFQSLPYDEYELEAERRKMLVPKEVSLAGKMYSVDENESMEGLKVYLFGEDGVLRDSIVTDSEGEFGFEKLNPNEQYSFSLDKPSSNYTMVLVDGKGNVIEKAFLTEEERFSYEKLTYQVAQFEPLDIEEAKMLEEQFSHSVEAKVFKKVPGDIGKVKVIMYDEDGTLLETTVTDKDGNFKFKKLDPEQNYIFKLETDSDSADYTLVTFDEENKVQSTTIRKQGREFVYSPLGFMEHKLSKTEAQDKSPVAYSEEEIEKMKQSLEASETSYRTNEEQEPKMVLFYAFDKAKLSSESLEKLKDFAKIFGDDNFMIEISSYTDQRGPSTYNDYLSKLRTEEVSNYLINNGIAADRIVKKWYGESKLIIDCDQKACDNEDHRLNRRSELRIIERD
jgi:outer membrane protein OmpA-like peptidoglycan-associated protein